MRDNCVLAVFASASFAQLSEGLSLSGDAGAIWDVAVNDIETKADGTDGDTKIYTGIHQVWGGAAPRGAFNLTGNSENVGFQAQIFTFADGTVSCGDNVKVWVKPVDMLKLVFGKSDDGTLATSVSFGSYDWDRFGAIKDEDEIIFAKHIDKTVAFVLTPVEGLTVIGGFNAPINQPINGSGVFNGNTQLSYALGYTGAAAVAYAIPEIGTIKVGVRGDGSDPSVANRTSYWNKDGDERVHFANIDAAFELTAVENLWVAVGGKVATKKAYSGTTYNVVNAPRVVAKAVYTLDALTFTALGDIKIGEADAKESDPTKTAKQDGALGFKAGAGVAYALENGLTFHGDVRYANAIWMDNNATKNSDCLTFGLGALQNYTNGCLGIGFELATNQQGVKGDKVQWAIPVKFSANF